MIISTGYITRCRSSSCSTTPRLAWTSLNSKHNVNPFDGNLVRSIPDHYESSALIGGRTQNTIFPYFQEETLSNLFVIYCLRWIIMRGLGRRRGAASRSDRAWTATMLIGLVIAMITTAMILALLLGTQLWSRGKSSPQISVDQLLISKPQLRGAAATVLVLTKKPRILDGGSSEVAKPQAQNVPPIKDADAGIAEVAPETDDVEKVNPGVDLGVAEGEAGDGGDTKDEEEEEEGDKDNKKSGDDVQDEGENPEDAEAAAGEDDKDSLVEHPEYPKEYMGPLVEANHDFKTWTAPGGKRFTEYLNGGTPYSITPDIKVQSDQLARSRRYHIRKAMKFAWDSYTQYAFGQDELLPQSKRGSNNWGGMGNTLVDSLDTLWLMGLKEEFYHARDWVRDSLRYDYSGMVSVFETTIRSLGGLLSAYDWSGDEIFLTKAQDLGARLFRAFGSASGIPYGQINLATGHGSNIGWVGSNAILAEAATLQLEFRHLAKATGKTEYATTSERVFQLLADMNPPKGLFPNFISNTGSRPGFGNSKYTFGAMSDSAYEYMLKIWLQGGRKEPFFRDMYDKAIQGMHDELLQTSTPSGLTYIADKNGGHMDHKMDHLVCFMGGLLALGAYTDPQGLQSTRAQRDLKTAKVSLVYLHDRKAL
jgi:mannosyl-oligosaccharide alpha-1,2-mannosidase